MCKNRYALAERLIHSTALLEINKNQGLYLALLMQCFESVDNLDNGITCEGGKELY